MARSLASITGRLPRVRAPDRARGLSPAFKFPHFAIHVPPDTTTISFALTYYLVGSVIAMPGTVRRPFCFALIVVTWTVLHSSTVTLNRTLIWLSWAENVLFFKKFRPGLEGRFQHPAQEVTAVAEQGGAIGPGKRPLHNRLPSALPESVVADARGKSLAIAEVMTVSHCAGAS